MTLICTPKLRRAESAREMKSVLARLDIHIRIAEGYYFLII
jgi:hypothetical protein